MQLSIIRLKLKIGLLCILFSQQESSTQKLLFHKDIPRYRKLIGAFFIKLEPVSDQDFLSEMDECSNVNLNKIYVNIYILLII